MKWSISSLLMSATVVGMLCIPRVAAASGSIDASGGRITFTGAIVEPTCAATAAVVNAVTSVPESRRATQSRFECATARTTVDSGQPYSLTVARLDVATINHDRVLEYFVGYVKATGGSEAEAKLVTQTFE
jgi:type 1 fimbria pilin